MAGNELRTQILKAMGWEWDTAEGIARRSGLSTRTVSANLRHMDTVEARQRPGWSHVTEWRWRQAGKYRHCPECAFSAGHSSWCPIAPPEAAAPVGGLRPGEEWQKCGDPAFVSIKTADGLTAMAAGLAGCHRMIDRMRSRRRECDWREIPSSDPGVSRWVCQRAGCDAMHATDTAMPPRESICAAPVGPEAGDQATREGDVAGSPLPIESDGVNGSAEPRWVKRVNEALNDWKGNFDDVEGDPEQMSALSEFVAGRLYADGFADPEEGEEPTADVREIVLLRVEQVKANDNIVLSDERGVSFFQAAEPKPYDIDGEPGISFAGGVRFKRNAWVAVERPAPAPEPTAAALRVLYEANRQMGAGDVGVLVARTISHALGEKSFPSALSELEQAVAERKAKWLGTAPAPAPVEKTTGDARVAAWLRERLTITEVEPGVWADEDGAPVCDGSAIDALLHVATIQQEVAPSPSTGDGQGDVGPMTGVTAEALLDAGRSSLAHGPLAPNPSKSDQASGSSTGDGLAKLRDALEFYADPHNWEEGAPDGWYGDGSIPTDEDKGQRARTALEAPAEETREGEREEPLPRPTHVWWGEWVCYFVQAAWTDDEDVTHAGRYEVVGSSRPSLDGFKTDLTLRDTLDQEHEVPVEWITSIRPLAPPLDPAPASEGEGEAR